MLAVDDTSGPRTDNTVCTSIDKLNVERAEGAVMIDGRASIDLHTCFFRIGCSCRGTSANGRQLDSRVSSLKCFLVDNLNRSAAGQASKHGTTGFFHAHNPTSPKGDSHMRLAS